MSEFVKCARCKIDVSNPNFRFCPRCGRDLKRKGIWVDCCGAWVISPWVAEHGYVPHCPFCGDATGQLTPEEIARDRVEREQRLVEKMAQEERARNPPLLPGVRVEFHKTNCEAPTEDPSVVLMDQARCRLIVDHIRAELDGRNNRIVVVAQNAKQSEAIHKIFENDVRRLPSTQSELVWSRPSEEKIEIIADKLGRGCVIFTASNIFGVLRLPYANRVFAISPFISDGWFKAVSRFVSPANMSKNPKILEYVDTGKTFLSLHQEKMRRYGREEAIIVRGEGS